MDSKIDILGRQQFVDDLLNLVYIISERRSNSCFAIDGEWGSGKTFVLEMFEKQVKEIQCEATNDSRYFVVHYNCWEYDYYEEPIIAIVFSLINAINEEVSWISKKTDNNFKAIIETAKDELKQQAGKFIENKLGIDPVKFFNEVKNKNDLSFKNENRFDSYFSLKNSLKQIQEQLKQITKEKMIIIVVDELDRCIPEYAIKVLERLHHIFTGIENLATVISVDSKQLENSVKQIYGDKVDVEKYLRKFIDFKKTLPFGIPSINIFNSIDENFLSMFYSPNDKEEQFSLELFENLWNKLDIRTQEKLASKMVLVHSLIFSSKQPYALFIFELLVMRFHLYPELRYDLSWVYNITETNKKHDKRYFVIDNELWAYLKRIAELFEYGEYSIHNVKYGNVNPEHTLDLLFCLLYEIYVKSGLPPYYANDPDKWKKDVLPSAIKFKNLINSID